MYGRDMKNADIQSDLDMPQRTFITMVGLHTKIWTRELCNTIAIHQTAMF